MMGFDFDMNHAALLEMNRRHSLFADNDMVCLCRTG